MRKDVLTPKKSSSAPKRTKMALGKGLDALIPNIGQAEDAPHGYRLCDVAQIRPNRYQPRRQFADGELEELALSIQSQGILQPLLVRQAPDGGYELVAGERRLRAAKRAGLGEVPVIVKTISDSEMLVMSIVENIQREDLNPMEEAEAYHRLIQEFDLTQDEAALRVGKSRSAVANFLRLRNLPEQIQASILDGGLSMGHARALLGAETPARQLEAWRTVVAKNLSVRATENLIRKLKSDAPPAPRQPTSEDRYLVDVADNLSRRFGTRVKISRKGQKGHLSIEFYSDEDLDRLLTLLGPD